MLESVKVLSRCSLPLKYMLYMGHEGLTTSMLQFDIKPECSTCHLPIVIECNPNQTLEQFINE